MPNKTLFGKEAREEVKEGMRIVHDAVAPTIGARGRNAVIHRFGRPKITNDGVSIARAIDPADPFHKMGADLGKEAAEKTNDKVGDGTSTSIVIEYALIVEGMKEIDAGASPVILKKQIEEGAKRVDAELVKLTRPVDTQEDLERVATISVEDPELGKKIAAAVALVGDDGIVSVEQSSGFLMEVEEVDGYHFDQGYITPYMVTNPLKMESVLTDCMILVSDRSWNMNKDFIPFLEGLNKEGIKNLLIICEDITGDLLKLLIVNHIQQIFHTVVVKKPYDAASLEDIATFTGGMMVSKDKGMSTPSRAYLGAASKVIVKEDETTIIEGKGDPEEVEKLKESLRSQIEDADDGFEKENLKKRLGRLSGKSVLFKVGAPTEAEARHLKDKVDDAVNATRAAKDGIIAGGGIPLYQIAHHFFGKENKGEYILQQAIMAPFRRIISNADLKEDLLKDCKLGSTSGINVLTGESVDDMFEAGIIDPVKVTREALKNAVSLATSVLTLESATVEIEDQKPSFTGMPQ